MRIVRISYILAALGLAFAPACQDGTPSSIDDDDTVWITIGGDALDSIETSRGLGVWFKSVRRSKDVALVEIPAAEIPNLSHEMHHTFNRCGGFFLHDSYEDGLSVLEGEVASKRARAAKASLVAYTIDNGAVANTMIGDVTEPTIRQTITDLSSFTTRYHTSSTGLNAPTWIRDLWAGYAAGRSDVTVELYSHSNTSQKSVILTIPGTTLPNEVVVMGGHLDSINLSGTTAPGADDDASGIATVSEVIRVAMANDFRPVRTVKFMAFAAEEVGLRGSASIANAFASSGVNVVGMMQLDMTNYKGSASYDIVLISDYTNAAQNAFIGDLIDHYLGLSWTYNQCGYGCSDHASFNNAGYPASIPFESRFNDYNPNIHTSADTLANSGGTANHAVKFAKLASAYLAELAKGGFGGNPPPPPPPPPPSTEVTETFSGSLSQGQQLHYGPFSVEEATAFTAAITGTGDADLYVRWGAPPTTSSYNCRPYKNGSSETCSLTVPSGTSEAYVMVRGYTSATFNLTVTYTPPEGDPDPPDPDPTEVTEQFSDTVAQGASDNFGPFAVVPGTPVTAIIAPSPGDTGDADLYVRFGAPPTTSSYDCRPYRWGSDETCNLTTPSGETEVYVMVRGYYAAAYELSVTHTIP